MKLGVTYNTGYSSPQHAASIKPRRKHQWGADFFVCLFVYCFRSLLPMPTKHSAIFSSCLWFRLRLPCVLDGSPSLFIALFCWQHGTMRLGFFSQGLCSFVLLFFFWGENIGWPFQDSIGWLVVPPEHASQVRVRSVSWEFSAKNPNTQIKT